MKLGLALVAPPVSHETADRRERIASVVREHGPLSMTALQRADVGWTRLHEDLLRLTQEGLVVRLGSGREAVYVPKGHPLAVPPAPKSEPRRLPMLEVGIGDRDNACDHYSGCLDRWLRHAPKWKSLSKVEREALGLARGEREGNDMPGRCPEACAWRSHEGAALERLHTAASRPGSSAAP